MSSVVVSSSREVDAASGAPHDEPTRLQRPGEQLVTMLAPDGTRHPNPPLDHFVADLTPERLLALHEDMVTVRRIDMEGVALQRQGQLGLWPPLLGQEAAQVGSARALRSDDFVFTSYREHAVAYCRGIAIDTIMPMWRGTAASGWNPFEFGMAPPAIIIGAQTLHATGYAMGCAKDGVDSTAIAYFGDGATSQGDVNEAMVFAATYSAPVVFFCQNNHWAISEPVGLVARRPLADRAPGFGIPSMRVDGNDVIAVMAATRWALERARSGDGPSWIEAVTYRMGPHTTSDDPSRYEDPLEREEWAAKDPIDRLERHLEQLGVLGDAHRAAVKEKADATAAAMRAACVGLPDPEALKLFDHVYTEPTAWLNRQRSQYEAYLAMFEGGDEA
ncbi:pyruvate dehydrogenase (acetyl-transferring) E1 component subunit alpha [Salinibacterium sp. dk2585]|uniref:pyruvate dehydrogenase (acetyl-transferring) E1 component subunit alpha n=1 Tax=unclassified Salinibacterium TaxID=2632331 RepID=UPI0011C2525C|nr:pyruvate dehydrogenase (acetyl-transferring) E1 component subunit alpha [Salinibacterium sp. dk2585]TXK54167.1 pyruvate dehydrogenase (acetyl-transferring) E1 component subunit alpha [Salinibacterium sp. dk5596]